MVDNLQKQFRPGENIVGEENQKDFIKLFGQILKTKNILSTFDEFNGKEILSERDFQDYQSTYLDLYSQYREKDKGQAVIINDDLIFEIELIKQVEINIDYILALVEEYHENNCADKEIKIKIKKALSSSFDLRDKTDLIEDFMNTLTPTSNVYDDWNVFVNAKKIEELNNIIQEENLNKEATFTYFNNAFRDGYLPTIGTVLNDILPPISRFNPTEERTKKREIVLEKFNKFFNFYWNIANNKFDD
jgi:type I restriction enzyme R subunit